MKITYRGHEIDAKRERSMAGYSLLYWSIFRASDGYEVGSGYQDSGEKVSAMVAILREHVDAELAEESAKEGE